MKLTFKKFQKNSRSDKKFKILAVLGVLAGQY